ncbi:MAG: sulfite exporter TauE/SafE family protein [Clostridia bacterium]|nr:sulfite exporter TauE/SafE family protein [Clostridia bacterium]
MQKQSFLKPFGTQQHCSSILWFAEIVLSGFCAGIINGLLGTGGGILLLFILRRVYRMQPKQNTGSTAVSNTETESIQRYSQGQDRCKGKTADAKDAFAASLACILPLSALSLFRTLWRGQVPFDQVFSVSHIPLAIGAAVGGMLGAWLLSRLRLPWVETIFALLMIFAGCRMMFS